MSERDHDAGAGKGDGHRKGNGWEKIEVRAPLPSARAARRAWDTLEPVPERPGAEERFLSAARAGRERRLLREAGRALSPAASGGLGSHLARARAAAGVGLDRVAEYVGSPPADLSRLETSDSALSRFGPPALAALVDLLEVPFAVAAEWIRAGLGPWIAMQGLRSAGVSAQDIPALENHLAAIAAELRERARADLLTPAPPDAT